MTDQPREEVYESSDFFDDGISARPIVPGTVARGSLSDESLHTGKSNGEFLRRFPMQVDRAMILRGRERYNIFCTPCHDAAGTGKGIVVQRGFRSPPSFHIQRLREARPGYIFDVITNDFGTMYDYAAEIAVRDRWAIVAYVRTLQFSRRADPDDVPPDVMKRLRENSS